MKKADKSKLNIIVFSVLIGAILFGGYFLSLPGKNIAANTIRINEYISHNTDAFYDSYGDTSDWIEIYNYGENRVWLGDIYISDDSEMPLKFLLPDIYIGIGEYIVVFASDKQSTENEIHVPFKLGDKDKCIVLSRSEDEMIDICEVDILPEDVSSGINQYGQWKYYGTPTPNHINDTPESDSIEQLSTDNEIKEIIISEYMADNMYTLKDERGISVDWIELHNAGDQAVGIGDIYISDDPSKPNKFLLPDYVIYPNEYLLIYADSQGISTDTEIYVPFSLSAGEQIILTSYNGGLIDSKNVELLSEDISAGLLDETWGYFASPSPGYENTAPISTSSDIQPIRHVESEIYINEVMTNNDFSILDSFGDTSDWIELYNPNEYDILLEGYGLSDDENNRLKWVFPKEIKIKANDYLLIYASGNNTITSENNELHTNFVLGEKDTKLSLSQPNYALVDSVDIVMMPGNVSMGRINNGEYGYFPLPTPLTKNTGGYTDSFDAGSNIVLQDVYINEVASSQTKFFRYTLWYFTEYIELYNKSDEVINLKGYSIMDSADMPWVFPEVTIEPDGYLVVLLKGLPRGNVPYINADLSISSSGEELVFKNADGIIIDYYKTGYLPGEYSSGRQKTTGSKRYFFTEKTPGQENGLSTVQNYSQKPTFSHDGGMVDEELFYLEISVESEATIRYTLDGSDPTEKSHLYTEPILIDKDTVVRAAAFEENKLPSTIQTGTYILTLQHTLPIVCLSTDPVNLFSSHRGIYNEGSGPEKGDYPYYHANYWFNWESPIAVEFYESDGSLALLFDAGLQIAGQASRAEDQKSMIIRLRDGYGLNEIYYPLFEDNEVKEFKHILLRTSGQDWTSTKIRDYYFHQSIKGYSSLDIMDGRPTAVYINGQYWGIYNIREKINADYFESHYGIDKNNVTIIEGSSILKTGEISDWNDLQNFCINNDFSNDEAYKQLEERVDVDAFLDYIIVETFYCNHDIANIKYWRENADGSKWRPILYDLDAGINDYNYKNNRMGFYFDKPENAFILYALGQNDEFIDKLIKRYAYFLNEVFTEENIVNDLDKIIDEISLEMQYHVDRWGRPYSHNIWQEYVYSLKENIIDRRYYVVVYLESEFDIDAKEISELFPWYNEEP